jgi:hypothetical protein
MVAITGLTDYPIVPLATQIMEKAAKAVVAQRDDYIRLAVSEFLGTPVWDVEWVASMSELVLDPGGWTTMVLDGTPLIRFSEPRATFTDGMETLIEVEMLWDKENNKENS